MKKKFMMFAVLLGALTLGSCIDDTESQSVTDVRDAKTEELKSIAAMESAQAAAKRTIAAAEAALKAAEADAQTALAAKATAEAELEIAKAELIELQKAAAEIQNEAERLANQQAQAELEAQLAALAVTKAENEAKLAEIAALVEQQAIENEKALIEAQTALNEAQDALNQAMADADEAEKQRLQDAADAYKNAVYNLIAQQQTLVQLKSELVGLETGMVDAKAAAEKDIADKQNQIALNNVQIETYKQYTNYIGDMDAARAELELLAIENNKLYDKYAALVDAYNDVKVGDTSAELNAVYDADFCHFLTDGSVVTTNEEGEKVYEQPDWTIYKYFKFYSLSHSTVTQKFEYEVDGIKYQTSLWANDSIYVNYDNNWGYGYSNDILKIELEVNDFLAARAEWKKYSEEYLATAQAQYNGKATEVVGYDEEGEPILKEIRNAVDSTAFLKAAYEAETDEAKKADLRYLYEQAIEHENYLKSSIAMYEGDIAYLSKDIAKMETAWDYYKNFDAYVAEFDELLATYNEAQAKAWESKIEAWYAYCEAYAEYRVVNAEYNALSNMLWTWDSGDSPSAYVINMYIQNLEYANESLETDIAELEKMLTDGWVNGTWTEATWEEFIAWKQAEIAAQEAVVAAAEAKVAETKATLDELMPAE